MQINPFAYLSNHKKQTPFGSEEEYNDAIVSACLETGIEVIGVTDHYQVKGSFALLELARQAGLKAFGGVEAVTKEGVHFLCLFDPAKDEVLERFIGECGIRDQVLFPLLEKRTVLSFWTAPKSGAGFASPLTLLPTEDC